MAAPAGSSCPDSAPGAARQGAGRKRASVPLEKQPDRLHYFHPRTENPVTMRPHENIDGTRNKQTMPLKITSIALQGFRAFRDFKVEELGRVNLITGKNNAGKTSLLEALRLLSAKAEPEALDAVLAYREEESRRDWGEDGVKSLLQGMLSLFHGFPSLAENPGPMVIAVQGEAHPMKLELKFNWMDLNKKAAGVKGGTANNEMSDDLALQAATWKEDGGISVRVYPLWQFDTLLQDRRGLEPPTWEGIPWVFVDPDNELETTELARLWDEITLTPLQERVIDALQIVDPGISAVNMISRGRRRSRIAVARSNHIPYPVPLRSFGDGMSRLFGIILSLVNAKDGLLLIDEFENGLHYTTQHKAWKVIFSLAEELDVQVFAASHSWDAVEAFQEAAAATPEVGALIRLNRRKDNIIPTVFNEQDLEVVTEDRLEVR